MTATVTAVRDGLSDLVGRAATGPEFGEAVAEAVGLLLSYDSWCLFGFEPDNGLRTFQFGRGGTEHTAEMAANEALQDDVNKYTDLGRAAVPAGWLSAAHPRAATSLRLHEILRPQGYSSELRLAVREGGRLWGGLCLFRDSPRRTFDDADAAVAAGLSGPLARVFRRYPTRPFTARPFAARPASLGGGAILLDPANRFVAVSGEAQAWLADLVPGGLDETWLDDVTRVVYDAANAVRLSDGSAPDSARAAIRTVSGRWLWVQGTSVRHGDADVAVLMQPATVAQLLPVVADIHGLTARELDVLERVAGGLATKHIARDLGLSPFTVNDHLKAIYRKCKVAGREELLGRLT
jgi:DNA-binding CsgD family transcriptional regulator